MDVIAGLRTPWLPLWGSCHEVTERVKISPLRPVYALGTSPRGRDEALIRHGCAEYPPEGKAWRIGTASGKTPAAVPLTLDYS